MKELSYCPACGEKDFTAASEKSYACGSCGFEYFHNAAAAVSAIIVKDNQLLMTVRSVDPGKGMLDLPGGFVDYHESAEDALKRELQEELGFSPENLSFFGTFPNEYSYKGILYHTVDGVFVIVVDGSAEFCLDKNEIADIVWIDIGNIPYDRIAFKSVKSTLQSFSNG